MGREEFTERVQAIRVRLYRAAYLYLGNEADALEAVDEAVYQLLSNPWRLENQQNGIRAVGKPYATRDLCEFILEVGNERLAERGKDC